MEAVTATSFAHRVTLATTSTLVVGGRHDTIFDPASLRDGVVAPIHDAQLQLLDCGHEIPIELPHELAALIEGFVLDARSSVPTSARR
jgi:hypothetical protein